MSRLRLFGAICLCAAIVMCGCGGKNSAENNSTPPASPPPAAAPAAPESATSATSPLDQGPRASESTIDAAAAKRGEGLFQTKGCVACHGFGKKITCPDLAQVPAQRSALWMENQILHPEKMTKEDPIARQLMSQYSLQMPNQGLTQVEARAVIEFIKRKGRDGK